MPPCERMNSSAIRSSSPVVIPGSSCSPTCAIVSATTRPAAAIFAISCADLRMIMRPNGSRGVSISAKTSSTVRLACSGTSFPVAR